jgi:Fe-S-cluster containining protein
MTEPILPPLRKFDPNEENPCVGCSNCCEYLALEIDNPKTLKDFDNILWYVLHKNVWVYVDEEKQWHVQFNTPCEKLQNARCGYYPNRPMICRDYKPQDCPRYVEDPGDDLIFKNEIDLFEYLAKKRPKMYQKIREKLSLPELSEMRERVKQNGR